MADDSSVGYSKPPQNSQFKQGKSGNPRGRPKGSGTLDIGAILASVLSEKVAINENGKRKKITKLEAAMKQVVNKAALADSRALHQLLALLRAYPNQIAAAQGPAFAAAGQRAKEELLEMLGIPLEGI